MEASTAALIVSWVGLRNAPARLRRSASPRPAFSASCSALTPTYATQPGVAAQVVTMAGLPGALSSPDTNGQDTVVPNTGPLLQLSLVSVRNWVKMKVSPDESARRTGTILVAGRGTPGFSDATAGSFHRVTRPWYIPASTSPVSLRSET